MKRNFFNRMKAASILFAVLIPLLAIQTSCTQSDTTTVHPYALLSVPAAGPSGEAYPSHVRSDVPSAHYQVRVAGVDVTAVKYDNTGFGNQGYNMDVARFASNTLTPEIEISVLGAENIDSITIHPVRFYPKDAITVSPDNRTVTFKMVKELPYAIVAINGGDPQDASSTNPQLTLINDPLEEMNPRPSLDASNVLDFKTFAENYLKENPITDEAGQVCRPAGSITDASLNDGQLFTWNYEEGHFVPYSNQKVAFPDKRVRNRNDVSDALQAALKHIQDTPELNTLYIPAGTYLWSGLRITDWNGDTSKGGKPLFIYTDENALMINRLKECREALEPAILIANSSFVTISGRGMHDAQGCYTFSMDRKDARNTPHQGGVVIKKSNNITFNDTYMRDSQQWNWETHDVIDVCLNNIKGLSPYNHGWVDGLNMSSGKNITVNGSITLGNDDTFATGHYNPSDEFPRRTYTENPSINLVNTDDNPMEIRHTFAAAGIYNQDRLDWSDNDSENISVSNAMGWTRTANCIRLGSNTLIGNAEAAPRGRTLKSYYFDNFHSIVGRKGDGDIRAQNNSKSCWPSYEELVIKNSSFWTPAKSWALIPTEKDSGHIIHNIVLENLYFIKPTRIPAATFSGIENLTIKDLYINGKKIEQYHESGIAEHLDNVTNFVHDFAK